MKGKMDILKTMKAWLWGSSYAQVVERQKNNKKVINHEPEEIDPIIKKVKDDVNIETMTKKQLEAFCRKEFGVELDRRHNKKRLLSQARKLIEEK